MKKKLIGLMTILVVIMGAGCLTSPQGQNTQSPIKMGWIGPLTGEASSLGNDAFKAAQMAVEEVNADGGIHGRTLELIAEDGKCHPKDASLAANKLIMIDKVTTLQTVCSGETMSVAPIAESNRIVVISNCAAVPAVTDAGDYIFRTYPSAVYQGKFSADYVYQKFGKRKVATLSIINDYGVGITKSFETSFKQLGGTVVASEQFTQDSRDLRSQLLKIKNSGAELIYLVAYPDTYPVAFKQAKDLDVNLPTLSPDSLDDTKAYASSFANGALYTVPGFETNDAWKAKLTARGGNASSCAPRSYDNVKLLADIMKQTGEDATKIKDALYQIKNFPGAGGPITFDQNGDPANATYNVMVIKDGKAKIVK